MSPTLFAPNSIAESQCSGGLLAHCMHQSEVHDGWAAGFNSAMAPKPHRGPHQRTKVPTLESPKVADLEVGRRGLSSVHALLLATRS